MEILSFENVLKKVREKEGVVIVGAGYAGEDMLAFFRENDIEPLYFFDNDEDKHGECIKGIQIVTPQKTEEAGLYIICVKNENIRNKLYEQLLSLGIEDESIVAQYYKVRSYEYLSSLKDDEIQKELDEIYYECFGKPMNWENPKTYNEKLNWEKIFVQDDRKTKLADKYLAREWVKEKIGEDYLSKVYGVWDKAEDIDFKMLPEQFVLKTNNGSARNIIVTDKSQLDEEQARKELNEWLGKNFYYTCFERQYKDIVPKIICEEYLEGVAESLYDYDVYCFHGEPKYIWCINGSHRKGCKASFYDVNWNKQPFSYGYPLDEDDAPKPENLDKMLELSRILSKDFEHARVDWYQYPASKYGILFSEITFTTWGGLKQFTPKEYDRILGDMI